VLGKVLFFFTSSTDFFPDNSPHWLNASFYGDTSDWCNTQVTDLYIPPEIPPSYDGSAGCCLIEQQGEINYWLDEENVKIWG